MLQKVGCSKTHPIPQKCTLYQLFGPMPEASRAKLGGLFSFAIKYDAGSAFLRLSLLLRCRFLRQFFISFMPARGSRKPQKVDLIFAYVIQSHTKSVIGRPGAGQHNAGGNIYMSRFRDTESNRIHTRQSRKKEAESCVFTKSRERSRTKIG